jgi:hypothetical protein
VPCYEYAKLRHIRLGLHRKSAGTAICNVALRHYYRYTNRAAAYIVTPQAPLFDYFVMPLFVVVTSVVVGRWI